MYEIIIEDWHTSCGEPMCCDDYGTDLIVNGENVMTWDGIDREHLECLLKSLDVEYTLEERYVDSSIYSNE